MVTSIRSKALLPLAVVAAVCALGAATTALAQETTGGLQGSVAMKADKSPLPGVLVEALHVPTGTRYAATTTASGRFTMLNVRVGGPYTVTAKLSGFRTQTLSKIEVALGERRSLAFELDLESVQETVTVTADQAPLITPDRMGSQTAVAEEQIKVLPTISRQFQDLARTNPYVNVAAYDNTGTNISIGGKNNRYNSIQIDGAVNNDLFGLGTTGTPGGQTYTQPISLDSVQELQVVVSPYDVKQGGFTGGAINAITRSGSNNFSASVYGSMRNENYVNDTVPNAYGDPIERPIASFSADQYGGRLGGPILKDKLFFFVGGEVNKRSEPTGGSADGSTASSYRNPAEAARFRQILIDKYGYDPGSLGDYNTRQDSDLIFGRLDLNAGDANQLTLRHNYVDAIYDSTGGTRSSSAYTFQGSSYGFSSTTNSTVAQLNSVFGASSFNSGRINYTTIRDSRAVASVFPSTYICSSTAQNTNCTNSGQYNLIAGTERSSGANGLDQNILEITDDFTLIKGNHTITLGTHNEFFTFKNLFIQDVYGSYFFNSVDQFDKAVANRYMVKFASGSDPRRPTEFGAQQWGLYAGDQWRVNSSLTLNLGLRVDVPRLVDQPTYNPLVDSTFGIDTTNVPNNNVMVSPRLGFNWNPGGTSKDQIRGGIGVFAGRTPYVWISNVYGGTGIERIDMSASNVPFNGDPYNPPKEGFSTPATVSVDTIDPDFKFPQVLRTTLAYDRELPFGIRGTVEGMFTKTLKDIYYLNQNKVRTGAKTFYGAPVYANVNAPNNKFSDVTYLTNTDRGEQQNFTAQLEKRFDFGLYLNASYAYMKAKAAFEGTSSVAYSNWQNAVTNGDIETENLTRSFYEVPHRFTIVGSQTFKTGPVFHNVGLVFTAQSGAPYSFLMGGSPNGDGSSANDLLFVPENYSDMVWLSSTTGVAPPTEAEWNAFVERNGLDEFRGRVAGRNEFDAPWVHTFDFHYDIELPISVVKAQLTFDVLNLLNLLNDDWGLVRSVNFQTYTVLNYSGIDSATGKPRYSVASGALNEGRQFLTSDLRSRWQIKLGARLTY